MISSKTAAILLFITLNMQRAASTTPNDALGPVSSGKSTPLIRKRTPASKPRERLVDTTNFVVPVEVQGRRDGELGTLQEPAPGTKIDSVLEDENNIVNDVIPRNNQVKTRSSVWQRLSSWIAEPATEKFKRFMEEGSYRMARCLAITINGDDLLKLVCSTVKTIEQYKGILSHLRSHNMVAFFYIHGGIEVVKAAIVGSKVYDKQLYVKDDDLETALPLALKEDYHDRVIELLDVKKGITAKWDEPVKLKGWKTSFGRFIYEFLDNLAPWEDGMALRRFLISCDEKFKNKCRDILDILCQELVDHLSDKLHLPKAERLLVDLIGQPLLLTSVVFARGFLYLGTDWCRSAFIKYGWRETIQEGLKSEHEEGGEELWRVMQREKPDQFSGEFPSTEGARTAVCAHLPTKQQKEDEWIKKYFVMLFNQLRNLHFLPAVLWSIISEYALSLVVP